MCFLALLNKSLCICSNIFGSCFFKSFSFTNSFFPLCLVAKTTCFLIKSFGPISILTGIPFNSHSLNFHPGVYSNLSSNIGLNSSNNLYNSFEAFVTFAFSLLIIGTITNLFSAIFGGRTKPLSSECIKITTPIERVERPHEFWCANCRSCFSSTNSIPNALEKFCPR